MDKPSFKKPLRYKGHDYRAPCSVHVTICTHRRQHLFGAMSATGVRLNEAGRFVETALLTLDARDDGVVIDTHIVMPDHLHAIIVLGTNPDAETPCSIPDLIRRFKLRVMRSWSKGVAVRGWLRYDSHLWQQSYYDTLMRNDQHLEMTRAYILGNPGRWLERYERTGCLP
jgi:REP element-mobilizing transposase RayT